VLEHKSVIHAQKYGRREGVAEAPSESLHLSTRTFQ